MAVIPTTRSAFTSTVWNSPGKATQSTNAAKFGGPNVNISQGSKVQFGDGTSIWDVMRVFDDGTLYLSTVSGGNRITRRVPPSSPSWTNLWMVDGRRLRRLGANLKAPEAKVGGGPNRNVDPGNVVSLGLYNVRWTVETVLRDGTLKLYSFNGDRIIRTDVGPMSKFWNSIYTVNS